MTRIAAYGTWPSVVTTAQLVDGVRDLSYVECAGDRTYWVESSRLMCAGPDGIPVDVLPTRHPVGSALYGYGAMPYAVSGATVFFVDAEDGGLHRCAPGSEPVPLTGPAGSTVYGAPTPSPDGAYVYCVRERNLETDAVHDLVAVAADGSGRVVVLARGHDFYGAPAVRPDGRRLAYVVWDHPHMAWDQSELREIRLDAAGLPATDRRVAGGPGVSVTQPRYGPDGRLHFVDDRTGWWNLYVRDSTGQTRDLAPMAAEFGRPDWHCGLRTYGFLADGSVVAAARRRARDTLLLVRPDGTTETVPCGGDVVDSLATSATDIATIAGSATRSPAVLRLTTDGDAVVLRESRESLGPEWTSVAEPLEFPTRDGETAHAFYYPPRNPDVTGPPGAPPPLIVSCHGGPTVVSTGVLDHQLQYWTSRGMAVVEVNYRGSPGFGRAYRERIRRRWGVVDVADCVDAARHLVATGAADPARLAVRGKSSGGLTALLAAMSGLEFAAVTSYSGVSDPTAIPGNTHKVEAHYLDGLIGSWPDERAAYEERSPAHRAHALRAPTLLFHGAEDDVVPPGQSRRLYELLTSRGVPVCLVEYEKEGHGFVRRENVRHTVAMELLFLARVLGFEPAERRGADAALTVGLDIDMVRLPVDERELTVS